VDREKVRVEANDDISRKTYKDAAFTLLIGLMLSIPLGGAMGLSIDSQKHKMRLVQRRRMRKGN
jgi:hypothetical protein